MKRLIISTILMYITLLLPNGEYDYFGGWPVNSNKAAINDPGVTPECGKREDNLLSVGCECSSDNQCESGKCFKGYSSVGAYCYPTKGTVFPRFKLIDQFGEDVDLYDFGGHGKLIVIEISAAWCLPCKQLSDWMANDNKAVTLHKQWKPEYNQLKTIFAEQDVFFINIQTSNQYKEPPSLESLEYWYQEYEDEYIPILGDISGDFRNWVKNSAFPTVIILNDQMEIVRFSNRGWQDAFSFLTSADIDSINANHN